MSEEVVVNPETKPETIDSDKSFESCVNEVSDAVCKLDVKDDDSEKSYVSCDDDKADTNETPRIEPTIKNNIIEEDEDDDIRPGSCREVPSSEDEVSSWDENNDHWIYDDEYLQEAESLNESNAKSDVLPSVISNQETSTQQAVPERKIKKEREFRKKQNPTYIPTSGRFYMHDIRSSEPSRQPKKHKQLKSKGKPQDTWRHDLYDEAAQKPLSRTELAYKYGNDGPSRPMRHQKQNQSRRGGRAPINQYYDYDYDEYQHQQYWYRYPHSYYDDCDNMYYEGGDYYYDPEYYEMEPRQRTRPQHQSVAHRDQRRQRNGANQPQANQNGHQQQQQQGQQRETRQKKPPSKYSQISELTEIRITVDRDRLGERQIHSATTAAKTTTPAAAVFNNGRGDGHVSLSNSGARPEQNAPSDDSKQSRNNRRHKNSGSNNIGTGPQRPGPTGPPRNRAAAPAVSLSPPAKPTTASTSISNTQRGNQNRSRQIPDWVDTKYEWGDGGDLPELSKMQKPSEPADKEKDTSFRDRPTGQQRGGSVTSSSTGPPPQPQPPRFSRGGHAPRRYSEVRTADSALVSSDQALLGYRHQGGMEQMYGGLAPLLLNIGPSQGPSSPSLVKQQHPQLVPLLQPGCYGSNLQQQQHAGSAAEMFGSAPGVGSSTSYFLQQFYLPPGSAPLPAPLPSQPHLSSSSRLNQFSPPFQPSFLAGVGASSTTSGLSSGSGGTHAVSVGSGTSTSTANVVARPVLGRS